MSIVYVTGKVQTIFWYISYFSTNFFGEYRKLQKKIHIKEKTSPINQRHIRLMRYSTILNKLLSFDLKISSSPE